MSNLFPEGVIEALIIGIDEEGMIHIATKMEDQDTIEVLEDALEILTTQFSANSYTMQ